MDLLHSKICNNCYFKHYEYIFTLVSNFSTSNDIYEVEDWLRGHPLGSSFFIRYFIANTVVYVVFFEKDFDACKFKFYFGDEASLTRDYKPVILEENWMI